MISGEEYLNFMEKESDLANQERISYGKIPQVRLLIEMLNDKANPSTIESYIIKNIQTCFNYAPHLTMQVYLSCFITQQQTYDLPQKIEALAQREDLPAKALSVVNSYLSILKFKDNAAPSDTFASDEKIENTIENLSTKTISRLAFLIQIRLEMGTSIDDIIRMLNPYMINPSKDPLYKITVLQQMVQFAKKYPATEILKIFIKDETYFITLDNSLDETKDVFLRGVDYYVKELNATSNVRDIVLTVAKMYRLLHYNDRSVLASETNIKSFVCAVINGYNNSIRGFSPSSVFEVSFPEEYKKEEGWLSALRILDVVFKARYFE
ncbi:MAG: hypothetical protein PHW22_03575 [Bacilli bacterium]|nr:hypothetical protein [Bacilli bacterium]